MRTPKQTRSKIVLIFVTFVMTLLVAAFAVQAQGESEPEPAEEAVSSDDPVDYLDAAAETQADAMPLTDAGSNVTDLSLSEAVNLAIENNLGVEIARHDPLIAEEQMSIAWGAYDPLISADFTYLNNREPNTSVLNTGDSDNTRTKTRTGSAGIGGLIPYLGASLTMDYTASRRKSNSGITSLSPQWNSGLAFGANIPLLKNLVWNEAWTQVEVSGTTHSAQLQDFREIVMDTVRNTIVAYWSLVAEEEQLRVAKKSLQTAEALLEQTKTQYEVGVKSKVEVIESEAGVAARELDVIRADATYLNTQDRVIDAVYGVRLVPETQMLIRPTDKPADYSYEALDPKAATDLAMENRPELASLKFDMDRQESLVRFRKNQRLPQLDLNVMYGTSGVEGRGNEDAFDPQNVGTGGGTGGDFSDTHEDWFEKRGGREYSVGAVFSIPLGNTAPRHTVSRARLELRRVKTQMTQLRQRIILEIRRDIRLLDAARKGIDASERQRIAAEEQLRAERIRLEHGESTPFDVLLKESELVEAEVAKIEALQLYRTSVSSLDRSQGTILRTHNIVVGSIGALRNGREKESFGFRDLVEPITPSFEPMTP
jgi:outer membrane protein